VVLARALLAHPDLLVIDDVAGVLDEDGRRLVRTVLKAPRSFGVIEATSTRRSSPTSPIGSSCHRENDIRRLRRWLRRASHLGEPFFAPSRPVSSPQ